MSSQKKYYIELYRIEVIYKLIRLAKVYTYLTCQKWQIPNKYNQTKLVTYENYRH